MSQAPNSSPPPGAQPLWGAQAPAGGAPAAARLRPAAAVGAGSGQPLEPLSRRLLQLAGLLSVLLIAVVANSLLAGGESPFGVNPVAAAAARVEDGPGARFNLYVVYNSPALPRSISAAGAGAYNGQTGLSRATFHLNVPTGERLQLVEISDGDYDYQSGSLIAGALPPGKTWVRTPSGVDEHGEPSLGLEDSLALLDSSGGAQVVGKEPINGTMTRRYRAEIQLAAFVDLLREKGQGDLADAYESIEGTAPTGISAEAWVDRKDLMRRFRVVMPMPTGEGEPPMTIDMRMDIFAYGAHPDIQLPDPDSVVDGPLDSSGSTTSGQIS